MANAPSQRIRVTYGTTDALFASQYAINATDDEIVVNFSSGFVSGNSNDEQVLPIHTRIALTRAGAARLVGLLQQALSEQTDKRVTPLQTGSVPQATFAPIPTGKPD